MDQSTAEDPIDQAMLRDRASLRRLRRAIRRSQKAGKPFDRNQAKYDRLLEQSTARRQERLDRRPEIRFGQELPIDERREEIAAAIADSPVVVVCGETGSGKSTQLPKICLAAGRGVDGYIGHTQPRRIAARSIAARISDEIGSPLGEAVGYKVRFHDETSDRSYIKLMTDGVLLAEAQGDTQLEQYDTIIIDEAHERSLNIDFLLGLLRRLLDRRRDLRVVITSATIDAERFAEHFTIGGTPAPIIEVSGRSFPVEVRYRPLDDLLPEERSPDPCRGVVAALAELERERLGDALVFLPTERDIRETARLLRGSPAARYAEIVPLYARLSAKEQSRVFERGDRRRIVLATNVAESSLTVPNIRVVIDTGTARIARYAPRSRVQRLPIEAVSRASADQRAGRCGRVGPGVCVRLYSEEDYAGRSPYATPEIRRTNLASVILRMRTLGLGEMDDFPLLDRPRPEGVREGYATLRELQAVDDEGQLTKLGQRLGRLPVDPRVGRMILAGAEEACLQEILIIAAALEVQDPREQPADRREEARSQHARFQEERSDFLSYLKLWDHLRQMREELSRSQFRKQCAKQFLSYVRILEWQDVHRQLVALAKQEKLSIGSRQDAYGAIHRALLAGLLSSIGVKRGDKGYQTPSGEGFQLWPGAGPAAGQPKWVMAAEVVETSRRYLRNVARIRPEWLPRLAEHLVTRNYREPRWSEKRQTVVASERLTLFGLPLAEKKTVAYGPINATESHAVFVREALAEEGLQGRHDFIEHNREVIEELRTADAKARRSTLLGGESLLVEFYAERIPTDVYDAQSFQRWKRTADLELLKLERESLLPKQEERDRNAFPDSMTVAGQELPLEYEYTPGGLNDGVTLRTPRDLVGMIDPEQLEWGVPGLLIDKLVALIRLLPKAVRTRLVPAPDAAQRVAETLEHGRGPFLPTIAAALGRAADAVVVPGMLTLEELPPHLRINLRVEDAAGEVLAEGRNLAALRQEIGGDEAEAAFLSDPDWSRDGFTDWSFGELPQSVLLDRGAHVVEAFPGLVPREETVDLRLFARRGDARQSTREALRLLLALKHDSAIRHQIQWLPNWDQLKKLTRRFGPERDTVAELALLIADRALGDADPFPSSADDYAKLAKRVKERIGLAVQEVTPIVGPLIEQHEAARAKLAKLDKSMSHPAVGDVRRQLTGLVGPGFWIETPWEWLGHLPRYLEAIEHRLQRILEGGGGQDARLAQRVDSFQDRLDLAVEEGAVCSAKESLARYRWMLEEFRVSVFAQKLGTSLKISDKRLEEQWDRYLAGG